MPADAHAALELRVELFEPEPGAEVFPVEGQDVVLSAPAFFAVEGARQTLDPRQHAAVDFTIEASDRARFERWTGERAGRRVAFLAGGAVVTLAHLEGPLTGEGVLDGGVHGFAPAEARYIVRLLRGPAEEPPPRSGPSLKELADGRETKEFEAYDPLHLAAKRDRLDDAVAALAEERDVDEETKLGPTPLMVAAKSGEITRRRSRSCASAAGSSAARHRPVGITRSGTGRC